MGDYQKIHPITMKNLEVPPKQPLGVSISSTNSSQVGSFNRPLQGPNPIAAEIPQPKLPKKGNCFCKFMCWTISLLVLVLILIGATLGILYLIFQPKLPNYSVQNIRISDLRLNFDMSLYAKFNVKIIAINPNKRIGIYYENGGRLRVLYSKTQLCEGTLPKFYQGHQNKTVLNVDLTGQTQYGNTIMKALQDQQQTGRIPLDLKVDAPVAIEIGKLKLKKVRVLGKCLLVVDSLTTNNVISIKASDCKFRLKL